MPSRTEPHRQNVDIDPDAPLRLADAAKIAFPMGGMTVSGLRREAERGRLVVEMIAGKQFTTLANIEEMRKLCRVKAKAPHCGSEKPGETEMETSRTRQHGSSETSESNTARDALRATLRALKKRHEAKSASKKSPGGQRKA